VKNVSLKNSEQTEKFSLLMFPLLPEQFFREKVPQFMATNRHGLSQILGPADALGRSG
jgi:hypothetical protein